MFVFPAHRFNPDPVTAEPSPRRISGGESLSGVEDEILADGGGRWEINYGEIGLDDPDLMRLWTQWQSYMPGNAFLVPVLSLETAPRPFAGSGLAMPSDILADDDAFPTFVRFASPYIVAATVGITALRATTISITVTQGATIKGGEKFSIGRRAHVIERVLSRDGQTAVCKISPPTREAIAAGSPVNFEWPVVQCRAAIGQSLAAPITMGMFGTTTISFVEDFSDAN